MPLFSLGGQASRYPAIQRAPFAVLSRLWVHEEAVDLMVSEARCCEPFESGGLLLGHRSTKNADIVVMEVTMPGQEAVRTRLSYSPDQVYDEELVVSRYRASNGRITYLGDWHSHPGAAPYLSKRDRSSLRRIALWPKAYAPNPIMLVVGLNGLSQCAGWQWVRTGRFFWSRDEIKLLEMKTF